jgi:outer membrane immunogenic protein
MKKKLLAIALFSATTGAMAQSAFEGFYGQLGIGMQSVSPTLKNNSITAPNGTNYNLNSSVDNTNSFTGTATLGYTFSVNQTFLLGIGAEYSPIAGQSGNYNLTNSQLNPSSFPGTYKLKNSYNVFLSPGIALDKESVLYAKLGYTGAAVESTPSGGSAETTNYTGYSLGLGYKKIISGGLYAFGEGNYFNYGNKSNTDSGPWGGGGRYTSSSTASFNAFNFLVGIGYRF